jgi:serine O-acetyltransferase
MSEYKPSLGFALKQLTYLPADVRAAFDKDPALHSQWLSFLEIVLYPGVWSILAHRVAHLLYVLQVPFLPRLISQVFRFLTGIEIHPGARIGRGFFIDHGMGVVIGETTEIGENVFLYHHVTLGARGVTSGKRHPTLQDNVMVGTGVMILGPVTIAEGAKIRAGSLVTKDFDKYSHV